MAVTHSDGLANFELDSGWKTAFNTTGVIKVYTGSPPGANAAISGTLLATLGVNSTAFAAAASRASTANAITSDTSAAATGTAGYFRVKLSGDADTATASLKRLEGTVSTSGADMNLSNTSIAIGGTVAISAWTYTFPV